MKPLTIAEQRGVIELVTAWHTNTELSAARQLYAIAKLLGVEPPEPVRGRVRRLNACHASADHVREKRTFKSRLA